MPIVAIINQKGGAGKSTIAVHLVRWLQKQKASVLLVDADAQCSSSKWLARLEQNISYQILQDPDELLDELPKLNHLRLCRRLIFVSPPRGQG
jgi:chromosome partitioning protein